MNVLDVTELYTQKGLKWQILLWTLYYNKRKEHVMCHRLLWPVSIHSSLLNLYVCTCTYTHNCLAFWYGFLREKGKITAGTQRVIINHSLSLSPLWIIFVFLNSFNNTPSPPLWIITCDHLISKGDTSMCHFMEAGNAAWEDIQENDAEVILWKWEFPRAGLRHKH